MGSRGIADGSSDRERRDKAARGESAEHHMSTQVWGIYALHYIYPKLTFRDYCFQSGEGAWPL